MSEEEQDYVLSQLKRLSNPQLETLLKFAKMQKTDQEQLFELIDDQPTLRIIVARKKAYKMVFNGINSSTTWIVTFLGVMVLGVDQVKAILKALVDSF